MIDTRPTDGRRRFMSVPMFPTRLGRRVLLAAGLLLLAACSADSERVVLRGGTMGTTWTVTYATGALDADRAREMIEVELVAINDALSTYQADAEISRLNATSGDVDTVLSERFAEVFDAALHVGRISGGAYDVTVGPLVDLWGFGAGDFRGTVPAPEAIDGARALVGAGRLRWDPETRRLHRPAGMRIDLSSIAKGYAVDRVSELLADAGVADSLVEIGGELRARGERPEGGPWRLAVESPDPAQGSIVDALVVSDASVATSGDYRNYFEVDGRRYSHLVDPRTGYPVDHELVSVTVIAEDCMVADALATALIVLGLDEARAVASREGITAQFVTAGEGGLALHYAGAFEAYRQATASPD